jgi:hypothetical protein
MLASAIGMMQRDATDQQSVTPNCLLGSLKKDVIIIMMCLS